MAAKHCCGVYAQKTRRLGELRTLLELMRENPTSKVVDRAKEELEKIDNWLAAHRHERISNAPV